MKPYSPACDQNRDPILAVLRRVFADRHDVLEVASGTGQHAVYFAEALPHLTWQTSDLPEHHAGIHAWLDDAQLPNVLSPLALDVLADDWPATTFDAIFNANTLHIVSMEGVRGFFRGVAQVLAPGGILCLYGPFNYHGQYTAESNARFDQWLRSRDPASGVRDIDDIIPLATAAGLVLVEDIDMPADNRVLVFGQSSCYA